MSAVGPMAWAQLALSILLTMVSVLLLVEVNHDEPQVKVTSHTQGPEVSTFVNKGFMMYDEPSTKQPLPV
jgi:hypothetical protein